MAEFRILSLDGGGSWALIQVRALTRIFERVLGKSAAQITGHDVLRHFDLAAANSGGTLTLAGLLHNWSLADLLALFKVEDNRRKIFAKTDAWHRHAFRAVAGIGPIYSTAKKRTGLEAIMGAHGRAPIADLPARVGANYAGRQTQLLFCAHNYDTQRAAFMRSDGDSRAASSKRRETLTLLDAVHASANPPVNLFDLPAECGEDKERYWDGAIAGHNNPVMAAVIETLANAARYNTSRAEIKALSLGTGTTTLPLNRGDLSDDDKVLHIEVERPWLFADVKKLALSIMSDPPDTATFNAHMLLDGALPDHEATAMGPSPIVRLNPLIQPMPNGNGGWRLPDGYTTQTFKALRDLDMDGVSKEDVEIIDAFCDRWMADAIANQPVRANTRTFRAEIGHRKFSQALDEAVARFR